MFIDEDTGRPNLSGIFACYAFPVLTVMIFWFMMGTYFKNDRDYAGEYEKLNAKNQRTKERMRDFLNKNPAMIRKARKWE